MSLTTIKSIVAAAMIAMGMAAVGAAVESDIIRTSTGEFVLNFQLPEGETLTPQKIAEIAAYASDCEAVRAWLGSNGIAEDKFADSGYGAASFLLGLQKILVDDAKTKITSFAAEEGVLRLTFEIREGEEPVAAQATVLSTAQVAYIKSIVRCAEDLGFKTEIEADKSASVEKGGKSLTVVIEPLTDKAAAFVRIVIPSVK